MRGTLSHTHCLELATHLLIYRLKNVRSWLSPVRILSGVTSTASTLYQAAGFVQEDKDNMAAKEVGMNVNSDDWVTCAVQ